MNGTVVGVCDLCGRPILYGNRPNGLPNGMTFKDCRGLRGNDVTLCCDCICNPYNTDRIAALVEKQKWTSKRSGSITNTRGGSTRTSAT